MQFKLIALRRAAGLTQPDMAKKIGINVSTYSNKECGKVQFRADEMMKIRDIFNVPMDEIFLPTNSNNIAINDRKE